MSLFLLLPTLVLFFLVIFLYTWWRLRRQLHLHPTNSKSWLPAGFASKTHYVTNAEGQKIAYWYFPVKSPKAVVILIHGYHDPGGKALMSCHVEYLHRAGYSTVLLDLRAHGESEGEKITMGVEEWKDVEAVYDVVKQLPENRKYKIGFMGISMGATIALIMAGASRKGDFVVASVPFKSLTSLYIYQLQRMRLPVSLFLPLTKLAAYLEFPKTRRLYIAAQQIKNIHVPVLLVSAAKDHDVNPQDAIDLYDLAHEPKDLWRVDCSHDVYRVYKREFENRVLSFLQCAVKQ